MSPRPSGSATTPYSSVGPEVICSACPSGKRCRQRWLCPSSKMMKYIEPPSGDHAAEVQELYGPTLRDEFCPSRLTSRHGAQSPFPSISTTKAQRRSGDGNE